MEKSEILRKAKEYAQEIRNNYDWKYYWQWAEGVMGLKPIKWHRPPVSSETFIDSPYYLNIGEQTFNKVKEVALCVIEGGYREGVVVAGIGCLTGDSMVRTENGLQPIRMIFPGTKVLSYNQEKDTYEMKPCFTGTIYKGIQTVYEIRISEEDTIRATANHPFLTQEGWKKVEELNIGERVAITGGGGVTFVPILSIEEQQEKEVVYDITVEDNHNFVANGFIVHNSGKSYVSQILGSYLTHRLLCMEDPHGYFKLAKDKNIVIVNMGTSAAQAKNVVFTGMSNMIKDSMFFKQYNPDILRTEVRFDNERIVILAGNSRETGPLGLNVYGAILDEAAFYRDFEGKDVAEGIYTTLQRRITSRFGLDGLLMMISSPCYEHDFIMQKTREAEMLDEKGKPLNPQLYVMQSPTWRFQQKYHDIEYQSPDKHFFFNSLTNQIVEHDDIDKEDTAYITDERLLKNTKYWQIPIEFEIAFRTNPEKAKRDYASVPSLTVEGFFSNSRVIDEMANPDHESPLGEEEGEYYFPVPYRVPHYIHLDLALNKGGRGDFAGLCFPDGTMITMEDGDKKPIEEIKIGDTVITHKGNKLPVTQLQHRMYTGKLYTITTVDGEEITATEEHPMFAYNFVTNKYGWKRMSKLYKWRFELVREDGSHARIEKVTSKDVVQYPVRNFGVYKDNSYIANGFKTHNCMVHIDRWEKDPETLEHYPMVYVDLIERIGADETGEINFEKIRQKIYSFQDFGFLIDYVSVDGFQCLSSDTQILMANYKKKPIVDIKAGEKVLSKKATGEAVPNEVARVFSNGERRIYRVWLDYGKYIDCTKDHAFLLRNGEYVRVEDMKIGDELMTIFPAVFFQVAAIDRTERIEPVWDIEVQDSPHNFATATGAVVHNSADMQQILKSRGIRTEYVSSDRSLEPYQTLKEVINMGRLDIYKYTPLELELKQLELVKGKKVDHPKTGCFTGNTKVMMFDGDTLTFEELKQKYNPIRKESQFKVFSQAEDGLHIGRGRNSRITKYVTELIEITLETGETIECTHEHPFMLEDLTYKEAQHLKAGDALKSIFAKPIKVKYKKPITTPKPIPVWDITVDVYENFALSCGVIVHNSKDLSDALACAVYNCLRHNQQGAGWAK